MILQMKVKIPEPIEGRCHRKSKPAAGDGLAGGGRVAENLEKEEIQDGSTES